MPFKLTFEITYPDERPLKRALVVYERVQDLSPAFERILPLLVAFTPKGGCPLKQRIYNWRKPSALKRVFRQQELTIVKRI